MRVLLHDYGGYAFTAQLGRALAGRGHHVLYSYSLTTQLMQRFTPTQELDNFTIEGVQLPGSFARYNYLQRWRDERGHGHRVAEQVRAFHPDVVLSANTPLDAQVLLQRTSWEERAKFIFWMQDLIGLATRNALSARFPLFGNLIGSYYQRLEKRLAMASGGVVVISSDFSELLRGWGVDARRVQIIPNWAPLDEIPVLPRDNSWSRAHELTDKFVFLYSGVLGLKHDAAKFLSLAESFKPQTDVRVVVVAEGPFAEQLKAESARKNLDNLLVLPYQPAGMVPDMLASGDVLMTILKPKASLYSVPSKVYAYMCAARPQLLSIPPTNPITEMVTTHKMGLVSDPADIGGWLENAHALHQNQYNNKQMAKNARAYAETNFDIDSITDSFESVFQQAF